MQIQQLLSRRAATLAAYSNIPFSIAFYPSSSTSGTITYSRALHHQRHFSTSSSSSSDTFSVAIVGAGPSGFYTAKYLHSAIQKYNNGLKESSLSSSSSPENQQQHTQIHLQMDLLDQLPTPYGLVRSGVAPDHPEVKNVQNDFQALFSTSLSTSSSSSSPKENGSGKTLYDLEFFGNVTVGSPDLTLSKLLNLYDAIILAYGCQSDRKLGIEGEEELKGVFSARQFVNWYNGHPNFTQLGTQISDILAPNPQSKKVAVIGQGNVALDCARILAKGGSGLYHTDLASHTLPILQDGVKQTTVLGRRGHVQGAFTIKELRELTKLVKEGHNVDFIVRNDELDLGVTDATSEELKASNARPKIRIEKLLRDAASKQSAGSEKQISLRFLLNPVRFVPKEDDPTRLGYIVCERTKLEGEPGNQVAVGTGQYETIEADMALISIGYKGVPLLELLENNAFDNKKGIVTNRNGKVVGGDFIPKHGLYVSGWLKRGPSGIIGSNIADAKDTVATIMSDLGQIISQSANKRKEWGRKGLLNHLRNRDVKFVNWNAYKKIDNVEMDINRRRSELQPREKITSLDEMLRVAYD